MEPSILRDVWDLTYSELGDALFRSEETVRRYCFRVGARKRLQPPDRVCAKALSVHESWIAEGRQPARPWLLKQPIAA